MGLDELMSRIGERVLLQEDLLRTAWAIRRNGDALAGLFDRFADVCLEQLFLDLEFRHVVEELSDDDYSLEVARLVAQCRNVDLPLPRQLEELDLRGDDRVTDPLDD